MKLTESEIKALIDGVWTGKYDAEKLPKWLYVKLAAGLNQAAADGWGVKLGLGQVSDIALEKALRDNVFYFAAHKEAHELQEMQNLLAETGNRYDFTKKALQVDARHWAWYNTEATMTRRLAQSGREWLKCEETRDTYPMLRWDAVNDANTRPDHAALDGLTLPVEHPFWKSHWPPLDWSCRCQILRVKDVEPSTLEAFNVPEVNRDFSTRVTDSREIWKQSHPYFDGLNARTKATVNQYTAAMIQQDNKVLEKMLTNVGQ